MDKATSYLSRLISITGILILLVLANCNLFESPKSELEKLPPATMEGKNTFGCLVNGGAWVTRVSSDVLAFYQSGVLQVSASVDNSSIDLIILNGLTQGAVYDLTNTPSHAVTFSWVRPSGICFYEEENTLIGEFNVTKLDQSKLIISGTFEFTTVTPVCDTIKVTNGRFDVLYAN